jgi:hypothetical protein
MENQLFKLASILLLALAATGCSELSYSYIESGHSVTGLGELHRPARPAVVVVNAQFYSNGKRQPDGDAAVKEEVDKDLLASGVLRPVEPSRRKAAVLKIDVDNRYDTGQAAKGGLMSGLSFGLVKATTRDDYHITLDYRDPYGLRRMGSYTHAIVTKAGGGKPPEKGRPLDPRDAFTVVIWQTMLDFLGDMQAVGNSKSVMFVTRERRN